MNTIKKILLLLLLLLLVAPVAFAQREFDLYGPVRTVAVGCQNFSVASPTVFTNGPIDMTTFDGNTTVRCDVTALTNSGATGGTLTLQIYSSPDKTNFTSLVGYAYATNRQAIIYTNISYGATNFLATNNYLAPFTLTTPNASTAGFAISYYGYGIPSNYQTNTGAITFTAGMGGQSTIGFNLGTLTGRYLYFVWTPAGTVTNWTTAISMSGMPKSTGGPY